MNVIWLVEFEKQLLLCCADAHNRTLGHCLDGGDQRPCVKVWADIPSGVL
jgi:hypothetical protein